MTPRNPEIPATGHASPIADLSYRSYDGPLVTRRFRWWIVALATIRQALRNRWYWVLVVGACLPYVMYGLIYYFWKSVTAQDPFGLMPPRPPMLLTDTGGHEFAPLFFQSFRGFELLWLFGIALLVGAGSIATDNRANALQVYLSKPITKGDYLLGKWAGIFVPVTLAAELPALVLYAFLGAAFTGAGFFRNEPGLIGRIVLAGLLPGVLHASLLVGFSAWSKTARLAGAFYAGFYFATGIVTQILWIAIYGFHPGQGGILQHMSVEGLLGGLGQNVYGVTYQGIHGGRVAPPDPWILIAVMAGACLIGVLAARIRVRAVEVVRG